MTFLPLIERQLRVRSRQRAFYWSRLSIVFLGALFVVPQLLVETPRNVASHSGANAFSSITTLLFALCCCAGALTANAIIEERNEGTLGLLYLTRVNAFDITAGALASAGFTCVWMLLAFVPLVTIPILAGGVSGVEALRKVAALIATLFLSLALGLRTPSGRGRWLKQVWSPVLLMIALTVVLYPISPASAFFGAAEAQYRADPVRYWRALGITFVLAPVLFVSASFRLRSSTKDSVSASPSSDRTTRRKRAKPFESIPDTANPIQTVLERDRTIRPVLWIGATIGVLFGGGLFMALPRILAGFSSFSFFYPFWVVFSVGGVVQVALFAWAAARTVYAMQQSGEMELLLTTPVGAKSIIEGLWTALRRAVRGPLLLMIAPSILWLVVYVATPAATWPWPSNSYLFAQALNSAINVIHTIVTTGAVLWLGIWFGISTRKIAAAVLYTLILSKGLPLLMGQAFSIVFARFSSPPAFSGAAGPPLSFWIVRLIPSFISLTLLWLMIRWARRRTTGRITSSPALRVPFRTSKPPTTSLYES
jgi:hypothetical protein